MQLATLCNLWLMPLATYILVAESRGCCTIHAGKRTVLTSLGTYMYASSILRPPRVETAPHHSDGMVHRGHAWCSYRFTFCPGCNKLPNSSTLSSWTAAGTPSQIHASTQVLKAFDAIDRDMMKLDHHGSTRENLNGAQA
jgi:hypothetical protein